MDAHCRHEGSGNGRSGDAEDSPGDVEGQRRHGHRPHNRQLTEQRRAIDRSYQTINSAVADRRSPLLDSTEMFRIAFRPALAAVAFAHAAHADPVITTHPRLL